MKELQALLGRSTAPMEGRVRAMEEKIRLAAQPPRQFSPEIHRLVADYLGGAGPLPTALEPSDQKALTAFRELVGQGVQLVEPPMKVYSTAQSDEVGFEESKGLRTLAPECAFLRLLAYRFHTPENQVHFCTWREGMVSTATLRPEYLDGLNFFLRQSQLGQVFYHKTDKGWEPIEWAHDFVEAYGSDPPAARVRREADSLGLQAARLTAGDDILYVPFREPGTLASRREPGAPRVIRRGDSVIVGGIVLQRRQLSPP